MSHSEFLFLGTGASSGIPMIGCKCPVCTSQDTRNHRLRPSAVVSYGNKRLLIDCGPDFRAQALKYKLDQLDGLLLTHSHFDHIAGIDELRIYYLYTRKALPVLLSAATYQDIKKRYDYLFQQKSSAISLPAQLDFHVIEDTRGTSDFLDLKIHYMQYEQAGMPVMGYRFGSLAYISDIRNYPESIFEDLAGVKILVLSALRQEVSLMHFNLQEAAAFAQKVGAQKCYITHVNHELEYAATNAKLPDYIQLAYDGLEIGFYP